MHLGVTAPFFLFSISCPALQTFGRLLLSPFGLARRCFPEFGFLLNSSCQMVVPLCYSPDRHLLRWDASYIAQLRLASWTVAVYFQGWVQRGRRRPLYLSRQYPKGATLAHQVIQPAYMGCSRNGLLCGLFHLVIESVEHLRKLADLYMLSVCNKVLVLLFLLSSLCFTNEDSKCLYVIFCEQQ